MPQVRWLLGMELARARAAAAAEPTVRAAALARAGDAYERARGLAGGAGRPGQREAVWRWLGRCLAHALSRLPGLRRSLEDRLLGGAG